MIARKEKRQASKLISRVLSLKAAIYLGGTLLCRSCHLLGNTPSKRSAQKRASPVGVAPGRVYSMAQSPEPRVRSYRTFPPLPKAEKLPFGGISLLHFP